MKYKVGDKVRIVSKWGDGCHQNPDGGMDKWLGKVMTIRKVEHNIYGERYRMVEDKHEVCFDCGWTWYPAAIAGYAEQQKIVVTTDGTTTLARLYDGNRVIKKAEAKCASDDAFDFLIGAQIALDRLMGRKEPQKLFPLADIKDGYLLKVENEHGRIYYMIVAHNDRGELGCCNSRDSWWPVDCWGQKLEYKGRKIVAIYGRTCNSNLLDNKPDNREVLWERHG